MTGDMAIAGACFRPMQMQIGAAVCGGCEKRIEETLGRPARSSSCASCRFRDRWRCCDQDVFEALCSARFCSRSASKTGVRNETTMHFQTRARTRATNRGGISSMGKSIVANGPMSAEPEMPDLALKHEIRLSFPPRLACFRSRRLAAER